MKSIDILESEHRDLESMLAVLEDAAARLQNQGRVHSDLLMEAVRFFERFGNDRHHEKEEALLFPLLAARGLGPEISVVRALQSQHDVDRAYLLEIKEGAEHLAEEDASVGLHLATVLREYVQLVKEHIRIEETLFGAITTTLSPDDDARLVEQFDALDRCGSERNAGRTHGRLASRVPSNDSQ